MKPGRRAGSPRKTLGGSSTSRGRPSPRWSWEIERSPVWNWTGLPSSTGRTSGTFSPKKRWEAIQQGTGVASEERRRLDLGDDPIQDIAEVMESAGVRTGEVPLSE